MTTKQTTGYRLRLTRDECPINPREDYDHLTTIAAIGRSKYSFDGNTYSTFGEFVDCHLNVTDLNIRDLIKTLVTGSKAFRDDYVDWMKSYKGDEFAKNLHEDFYNDYIVDAINDDNEEVIEAVLPFVDAVWKMVYVNSQTGESSCSDLNEFDSGNGYDGIVYIDFDAIKREYGEVSEDSKSKADTVITGEMSEYSSWASGDVWYYELEEGSYCRSCDGWDWEHSDSCGGFYGLYDDHGFEDHILSHLGEEHSTLLALAIDNPEEWQYSKEV